MDVAHEIAKMTARLDKQAAAIRDLRAQVKALQSTDAQSTTQPARSSSEAQPAYTGAWVPSTTCLVCGEDKDGRLAFLTCKPCGTARNAVVYSADADKSSITTTHCAQCQQAKPKASTSILCPDCSAAHKDWKAHH